MKKIPINYVDLQNIQYKLNFNLIFHKNEIELLKQLVDEKVQEIEKEKTKYREDWYNKPDYNLLVEDNPVPSLDKIKQLCIDYQNGKRTSINTLYEIELILQNGVETDKEQPDYKKVYFILMEYWDSLPDEEKPLLDEKLKKYGL